MKRNPTLGAALVILAGSLAFAPASESVENGASSGSSSVATAAPALALPPEFVNELVFVPRDQTTGFLMLGENDFLTWRKKGHVERWHDGGFQATKIVDISEEVGDWSDHGLHAFARDPDYANNGYVYLYYVVDRYHLENFGMPGYDPGLSSDYEETIGRITRYTVLDPSNPGSPVDPASRLVLVGATKADGIPICAASHGIGMLAFGHDGSLLFSTGDTFFGGQSPQQACQDAGVLPPNAAVDNFRSQYLESANGKILRIDPATGAGLPSNPFYDGASPSSWTSRVWALGLRNPYRFGVRPEDETSRRHAGPGALYIGDVGANRWEELSVSADGGENFGWPLYEALEFSTYWAARVLANPDAPNPLFGMPGCTEPNFTFDHLLVQDTLNPPSWPNPCDPAQQVPASIPRFMHTRPRVMWSHPDLPPPARTLVPDYDAMGNAISLDIDDPSSSVIGTPHVGNTAIGGVWYEGTRFPAPYADAFYCADFGQGWIKAFLFDDDHELLGVVDFASGVTDITFLAPGFDGEALYYLRYQGARGVYRIEYDANVNPVASATATPRFGPAPLIVRFDGSASFDPNGDPIGYSWDFGDNSPWTPINAWVDPIHVYGAEDVTDTAQIISGGTAPSQPTVGSGSGRKSTRLAARGPATALAPIKDGVFGTPGMVSAGGTGLQATVGGTAPWFGYRLPVERELIALIFQEGIETSPSTGKLPPLVETWDKTNKLWVPVSGLQSARALPGSANLSFETFHISFNPVDTERVRLRSADPAREMTCGELRVLATDESTAGLPSGFAASLTVDDPEGLEHTDELAISTDNTPPSVTLTSPLAGQTYPVGVTTIIPLTADVTDLEHGPSEYTCAWEVELVHDNHSHPEPLDVSCAGSLTTNPHGELSGNIIFWRVELTVTDDAGLSTSVQRDVIPEGDCNLNGIDDALDIATGTSFDVNSNGVPDECEGIQRLRRVAK